MQEETTQDAPKKKHRCPGGKPTFIGRKERARIAAMLESKTVAVDDVLAEKALARDGLEPRDFVREAPHGDAPNYEVAILEDPHKDA